MTNASCWESGEGVLLRSISASSCAHASSFIKSFLGPAKGLKCVVEESEVQFVSCPTVAFQLIALKEPIEYILQQTLQAHHEYYGCGTNTLLAMWYFWNEQFKVLIENGYVSSRVSDVASYALNHVISHLPLLEISITSLTQCVEAEIERLSISDNWNLSKVKISSPCAVKPFQLHGTTSGEKNISAVMLKSRHFSSYLENSTKSSNSKILSSKNNTYSTCVLNKLTLSNQSCDFLLSFVNCLGHGVNRFSSVLANMWKHQIEISKSLRFYCDLVSVCTMLGPVSNSSALQGLLLKVKSSCLFPETMKHPRALMLSGDVTMEFMHLGFSPSANIKTEKPVSELQESKFTIWKEQCIARLQELQVTVLFVHGSVDAAVVDYCRQNSISLLCNVPQDKFQLLISSCGSRPSTYLLDCKAKDVISFMSVKIWPNENIGLSSDNFLLVSLNSQPGLQTAVLCHPSPTVHSVLEHQFWHNISRLMLAIKAGTVLPGNAKTEMWAVELLQGLVGHSEDEKAIITATANGFSSFSTAIMGAISCMEGTEDYFDEIECKVQAWKTALALSVLSLNADAVVTNQYDVTGCRELGPLL